MKNSIQKKFINILVILLISSTVFISCKQKQEQPVFEQTVEFTNDNWDFTQRTIEFDANITDTINPYRIEVELKYGFDDERVDEMPLSFSVTAPDGGSTSVSSAFLFNDENATDIEQKAQKMSQSQLRVLFEKKYFNRSGVYHFRLNRHSEKFDNYNMQSLTLRIEKL
ncbi:MAG: gliding motility lipoprotein GldH [Bacteroidales bacterium]|nr:gliding motility lipoprotein GldH [Bacteroidales bacterium]